jgi:hypothetical protein
MSVFGSNSPLSQYAIDPQFATDSKTKAKEYMRAYNKEYRKNNPNKRKEYDEKRRAFNKTEEGRAKLKEQYQKAKERGIKKSSLSEEQKIAEKGRIKKFKDKYLEENGISYDKKYFLENKADIYDNRKKLYNPEIEENRDRIVKHRENKKKSWEVYYEKIKDDPLFKEKRSLQNKESYYKTKSKRAEKKSLLTEVEKGVVRAKRREYYLRDDIKEKRRIARSEYRIKKYREDEMYRFSISISRLIKSGLTNSGLKKSNRIKDIIGCSIEFLRTHLENQFEDWMNWDNRGVSTNEFNKTWQIDHIIPISQAKNMDDFIRLSNYTNLRPLCALKNSIKRNFKEDDIRHRYAIEPICYQPSVCN